MIKFNTAARVISTNKTIKNSKKVMSSVCHLEVATLAPSNPTATTYFTQKIASYLMTS